MGEHLHDEWWFGLPWAAMWCANPESHLGPQQRLLRTPWLTGQPQPSLVKSSNPQPSGDSFSDAINKWNFDLAGYGVPLGVLPMGFALNTLTFGALWAVVLFGLPAAYRFTRRTPRRLQRGECARCGYSREGLAESAACPECGHAGGSAKT